MTVPELRPGNPARHRSTELTEASKGAAITRSAPPPIICWPCCLATGPTWEAGKLLVRHRAKNKEYQPRIDQYAGDAAAVTLRPTLAIVNESVCSEYLFREIARQTEAGKPEKAYNEGMARGWESKSVESQIDDASRNPAFTPATPFTEEERQQQLQRNNVMLSRTRILAEMKTACNTRFREQLARELAFLDEKIAVLTH